MANEPVILNVYDMVRSAHGETHSVKAMFALPYVVTMADSWATFPLKGTGLLHSTNDWLLVHCK